MVWLSAQMLVALFVGKRNSRPWIVSDELWSLIEPLLPEPGAKLVAGRPRVPDRQALCGILFVLHTGIQWEYPAPSPGCTASGAYASAGKDATTSHEAFLGLATCLITHRHVQRLCWDL